MYSRTLAPARTAHGSCRSEPPASRLNSPPAPLARPHGLSHSTFCFGVRQILGNLSSSERGQLKPGAHALTRQPDLMLMPINLLLSIERQVMIDALRLPKKQKTTLSIHRFKTPLNAMTWLKPLGDDEQPTVEGVHDEVKFMGEVRLRA
jgi:hypothetical protein